MHVELIKINRQYNKTKLENHRPHYSIENHRLRFFLPQDSMVEKELLFSYGALSTRALCGSGLTAQLRSTRTRRMRLTVTGCFFLHTWSPSLPRMLLRVLHQRVRLQVLRQRVLPRMLRQGVRLPVLL